MSSSSPRSLSCVRRFVVGLLAVVLTGLTPVVASSGAGPAGAADAPKGYWMVASDGGIFAFGGAKFFGSTGAMRLNMPIVGMAATPSGAGYWLVASDGGIFSFGDAGFFGSTGAMRLNMPIVGMAATPSGRGYWLVASDGGVFSFGDAGFFGSTGDIKLNKPITGMTPSATGGGYRMVASDGGIFSFGDAAFHGSAGGEKLAKPIAGMAPTPSGRGYWIVGSDGAIFPYGDAAGLGAATALRSVAAMASTASGAGYWAVAADGKLAAFGDATDLGHPTGTLARPIVGMAVYAPTTAGGTVVAPPATDPGAGPTTTPTTSVAPLPPAPMAYPLYSSRPLAGTVGTPPHLKPDPDHPHRTLCYKPPCTRDNAVLAQEVRTLALAGDRLFVGGGFRNLEDEDEKTISPETAFLAELDARTGQPAADQTFAVNAAPDDTVEWMVPAPDGKRLYVAGRFRRIGGGESPYIAALDMRTGLLDPTFNPPDPDGDLRHVDISADRVFIGGEFLKVGDTELPGVAAYNMADGSLIEGWTPPINYGGSFIEQSPTEVEQRQGVVEVVKVADDGKMLLVGGTFEHFGWPRKVDIKAERYGGFIALDTSDGRLSDWHPVNDREVHGMVMSPDKTRVYIVEGGSGGWIGAFDPGGQEEPLWVGRVDGDVLGVAATDQRVYVGGHFDAEVPNHDAECLKHIPTHCVGKGGTKHRHLVAFDMNGRSDPGWTAQADTAEGPSVLLAGPHALYVGGNFQNILERSALDGGRGIPHPGFAMFPAHQ
jgi:hypothetical protein